jgi:hypothetical protein
MTAPFGMDENAVIRGTELRLDKLVDGLQKAPATLTQITVNGVNMTVADVLKKVLEVEKPWKDARAAHAVLRALSLSREQDEEKALALLNDVKAGLVASLGRQNQALTDYGFRPQRRRTKLTLAEKTARSAKAKLTRELRHTMGPKEKAAIKATGAPVVPPAQPSNGTTSPGPSSRVV